jgi:hypothetical protein
MDMGRAAAELRRVMDAAREQEYARIRAARRRGR